MSDTIADLLAKLTAAPAAQPTPPADDRVAQLTEQLGQLATVVERMASAAPAAAPAKTPAAPPISDYGSPVGSRPHSVAGFWRAELSTDPLRMSAAARRAMDAELGREQARAVRVRAVSERGDEYKLATGENAAKTDGR